MSRKLLLLFIVFFVFTVFPAGLSAQSVTGTWTEPNYKIQMVLNADGTYILQQPNGRSQGRYGVNGQNLCFQDASGAAMVCYAVVGFNNNILSLRDMNGVVINYQRRAGGMMPTSQPVQTPQAAGQQAAGGANALNPGQALAQNKGVTLFGYHFNAGLGIVQFVIGRAVKPSEATEMKNKLIEEFNIDPGEVTRQLNSMNQSLQQIRSSTDPVRIGMARQELFSALYQATLKIPDHQKPLMVRIMNRYIKALAYDPTNKMVLTDRDVDAYLKYIAFNNQMMGQTVQLTQSLKQSITIEMVNRFPTMSIEQKRLLCSAGVIWLLVETNWNRMTPAQKQQYKNAYYAQMNASGYQSYPLGNTGSTYNNNQSNQQVGANTQYPKASSGDMAKQMREFRAKQNMFNMMNNMNTNSHALSLNIIENMGGTGNYWTVTDY